MAITNNGIVYTGGALKDATASGYTPTGTSFSDWTYKTDVRTKITIDKATVDDATPATTFAAINAALVVLEVAKGTDYDAANTVDTYAEASLIQLITDPKYTDSLAEYIVTIVFYVKVV